MGLLMGGDRMNRFKNLKNRLKLFKPTYDKRETAKADMLEIYTRWRQGEKLSRKEMQLLQASEQHRELEPLKQIIDIAHAEFRERESIPPRPGAKERAARALMAQISRRASDETELVPDVRELQPAYSLEMVGSDSELAFLPPESPPPATANPFSDTVIVDGQHTVRIAPAELTVSRNLKLKVVEGEEIGREYNLAFLQLIIGRGLEAVVQLDTNPVASRRHSLLTINGDDVLISDLGSINGTHVNGVRIDKPTPLQIGTQVAIGGQSLEVIEITRDDERLSISFREVEGANVGQIYSVNVKEMTVGRGKAARIRFADPTNTLSRVHARFDLKDERIYITDLGSKNGTYVNGERIDKPTPVDKGSVIKFGGVVCEVASIETLNS